MVTNPTRNKKFINYLLREGEAYPSKYITAFPKDRLQRVVDPLSRRELDDSSIYMQAVLSSLYTSSILVFPSRTKLKGQKAVPICFYIQTSTGESWELTAPAR